MSRGPDNVIAEYLEKVDVDNHSLIAEGVLEALEEEKYIPVQIDQIRTIEEYSAYLDSKDTEAFSKVPLPDLWIAYNSDGSAKCLFGSELEAYKYCVSKNLDGVKKITKWGDIDVEGI